LREEHRLRVFENRVSRKIFGCKREEDGSQRRLHNDEFHSLCSSWTVIRMSKSRMRWTRHVAHMEDGRSVCTVLVGRPEVKSPQERCRNRWKDNIKMDLRDIRISGAK
jgi:hypothetical protein